VCKFGGNDRKAGSYPDVAKPLADGRADGILTGSECHWGSGGCTCEGKDDAGGELHGE
jgi:hypothetical protein